VLPIVQHALGIDGDRPAPRRRYHLARFLILRLLGLVYFTGFLILVNQGPALLGSKGLLPVAEFIPRVVERVGSNSAAFAALPSVFWLGHSDGLMRGLAWFGAMLSLLVLLGLTNAVVMALLWALYMSFVHVGQDWYGYGWEFQLLETGFLAIFLCPVDTLGPFPSRRPAPIVVWLFRWLIFRIMIDAGLIKIRGDECWRNLTCLDYYYETQPNPNPFSRLLHLEPHWISRFGVVFNHTIELGLPWLLVLGTWATRIAGLGFVIFQATLIAGGNLSFLNWLTIVPALACFDDECLAWVLPHAVVRRAEAADAAHTASTFRHGARVAVLSLLALGIAWLSIPVVTNLLSAAQVMNTSFEALDLVNTYGAFGSIGRERLEVVFEGTADPAASNTAGWREYPFKCAPTDVTRRPCVITPYHYRLDWQIWFAAMSTPQRYPWTLRFAWKLLHNDPLALSLLAGNPFPGMPPRYVRARLYVYKFASARSGRWWDRRLVGDWLPPLSVGDQRLLRFLQAYGWSDYP
jgi:hypothetical protein